MYNQGFTTKNQSNQPASYQPAGYQPAGYQQPSSGQNPAQSWYQTPPQTQPQPRAKRQKQVRGGGSSGGNGQKPKKKRSFKWQLVKFLLILIVLAGAAVGGYLWKTQSEVRPYQNIFLDNIYVDGIELSGKSWAQGSQLVWDHVNAKQNGWYVRLKTSSGLYNDITAGTLGIAFDPTAALSQAWAIGHNLSGAEQKDIFALQDEITKAKSTRYEFSSAQQSADTTPIDSILQTLEAAAYRAPQNASISEFAPDNTSNPFIFVQEVYGQSLDTTQIKEQILYMVHNLESGEILLEPVWIAPAVTVADLQKTVALRYRAITAISSSSTEERTENIRVAFRKLNGVVIKNGDRLSFNKVVGTRTMANGFYGAIEYAYGEEVMGVGGGVCQASTTLYMAAIQAGMTITKRSPHSNPVNYTLLGLDATVNDMRGHEVDFAFKNGSGAPVYVTAHVIQGTSKRSLLAEVCIYGADLGSTSYELESVTVETIPKIEEAVYKEDKNGEYATYTDEQVRTVKGREGYISETYLCTYEDGVQVARTMVSRDTYEARADVYRVGVIDRYNP
ncbi:MAG: hypothetical protein GX096_09990 [Clostridiales bacterium]|nr:hypothetical protein [Clostridiales bacterium]